MRARQRLLLCGHEHPDGDCLGAQSALFHLHRAIGIDAVVINPDPVPRCYRFLTATTPIAADVEDQPLPDVDGVILLDCAHLSRLGVLGRKIRQANLEVAVVDHHVGSESGDGSICFVDSSAPATGAMVYQLYRRLGVPLGRPAAEGIFVSLTADTGWFRYSNTDADVLRIAGELVGHGLKPSVIYDRIYRGQHPESVDFLSSRLAAHRVTLGGRFGYASLDRSAMHDVRRIDFDTDTLLEPIRSVDGVQVVGLFREQLDGSVKISLRATGDVNVRDIARQFGGGGHVKAAGAVINLPLAEAVELVESRVGDALRSGSEPIQDA